MHVLLKKELSRVGNIPITIIKNKQIRRRTRVWHWSKWAARITLHNSVRITSLLPCHSADLAVRLHLRITSNRHRRLHGVAAADRDRGKSGRTPAAWRGLQACTSARHSKSFQEQMCQFEGMLIHYEEWWLAHAYFMLLNLACFMKLSEWDAFKTEVK